MKNCGLITYILGYLYETSTIPVLYSSLSASNKETKTAYLSLLSEVKRNDKGTVEIKLIDRLRALEQLAQVAGEDTQDLEAFLQALQGEAE